MKRQIIEIDESKCNGCGLCVPNCQEGALQIIGGKARLVSELMCDGLGACLGHCPEGAIIILEREAEPYDEVLVMAEMVKKGKDTVLAHLNHLKDHREEKYLSQGLEYLLDHADEIHFDVEEICHQVVYADEPSRGSYERSMHRVQAGNAACGCPGSHTMAFAPAGAVQGESGLPGMIPSSLTHWPVQMHLLNPLAAHFRHSDLLLAADCVAYALGGFHKNYLKGKTLAIACPKLDTNKEVYLEKLVALLDQAMVNTITVMKMEVPCCGGLLQLAQVAASHAKRKVPLKFITVGIQGDVLEESWI